MSDISKFNVADYLETEQAMAEYLEMVLEENDPSLLIKAIGDISKAKSINEISKNIGVNRESLYKSLSGNTKVSFNTIYQILNTLGLKLSITPKTI